MHRSDMLRYCLWCGVVATAEGNRRQYTMATTWLPHLLTNTVSLLLPDALRLVARERRPGKPAGPQRPTPGPRSIEWCVIGETLSICPTRRPPLR